MERGILRVGRTSEGLQSGCSGRPWASPPPQTWPPKRSRGAREVARARPAVRAAALRSFESKSLDLVIIETTGLADPIPVAKTILLRDHNKKKKIKQRKTIFGKS